MTCLAAAELKVDLSQERVGQPPTMFQPIVGSWRVVQDGPDKVIMVDGQPWKANQNNRTVLLAERARSFYSASQEDFIDKSSSLPTTRSLRLMASTTSRTARLA
jgi:hypothetical protein